MNKTFKLIVRTPEKDVYSAEVHGVSFSSEGGDMEVFADHAGLTATLAFSPLVIDEGEGSTDEFVVRNGMFLFDNEGNEAVLLAMHAEKKSEVSLQTVKEYMQFIEEQLAEGKDLSDFQIQYLEGEKLAVQQQMDEVEA